jgi:hypothetical protein
MSNECGTSATVFTINPIYPDVGSNSSRHGEVGLLDGYLVVPLVSEDETSLNHFDELSIQQYNSDVCQCGIRLFK